MLGIEDAHIKELDDKMLRDLIGLLCEEELRKFKKNGRNVFWGGNQNAADGGIDVYCEYEGQLDNDSFIPRNKVGFQVKLSDYTPGKISSEMLGKGILKVSIQELCKNGGAYILVCGRSSVSLSAYKDRIIAMKKAVQGYPGAENICLDFMDSNRIATWVRNYPALITWVREKINKPIQGWKSYGNWSDTQNKKYKNYVMDQSKRLYDYIEDREITILEGIQKFRSLINKGSAVIRLTGLSGVGKTRMLETLFDPKVGTDVIDSKKVIYADAAESLIPSAEQMLRDAIFKKEEVVIIIDNCSAELHMRLTAICRTEKNQVNLITVEYDVKNKSAEETASFILKPASNCVIENMLIKNYENIPLAIIDRIAEISGGNARLALLFAKSLSEYNRDITSINDTELFNRLFWQKGKEDTKLMRTAETFSLLYSVDYEDDGDESELKKISNLLHFELQESIFYLEELKKRDILQTRGIWCAILPHALSNYLALNAIQYYRVNTLREVIIVKGTDRMKMSFSHRLSFLYEDEIVKKIAEKWLDDEFTDLSILTTYQIECFYHLAKISPYKVITCIRRDWNKLQGYSYPMDKIRVIIITLVHFSDYFKECIELIMTDKFNYNKKPEIERYFPYSIFMNKKCADVRYNIIKQWIKSDKKELGIRCLLKTLTEGRDVGLEYRDFPDFNKTIKENIKENEDYWFKKFTDYIQDLICSESDFEYLLSQEFTNNLFWLIDKGYINIVREIAIKVRNKIFWREGYIAIKRRLLYKKKYSSADIDTMEEIEKLLMPQNVEEEILYWCMSCTSDVNDRLECPVEKAFEVHNQILANYGKVLADDFSLFKKTYKKLLLSDSITIQLGRELAKSDKCDLMWTMICDTLKESKYIPGRLDILNGIIIEQKNTDNVKRKLSVLLQDDRLIPAYIALVIKNDIFNEENIRFRKVIEDQKIDASIFYMLSGCKEFLELNIEDFVQFMYALAKYNNSNGVMWRLFNSRVQYENKVKGVINLYVKKLILDFLVNNNISINDAKKSNSIGIMISSVKTIISLLCECDDKNIEMKCNISKFYYWLKDEIERNYIYDHDVYILLDELYKNQPVLFLDIYILNGKKNSNIFRMLRNNGRMRNGMLLRSNFTVLKNWCDEDPDIRYSCVFDCTYGYEKIGGNYKWGEIALWAIKKVKYRKNLALKLMKSIEPIFANTSWSKEREPRECLFELFEKDEDIEIMKLAIEERKKFSEITDQHKECELVNEKLSKRFE